MKLYCNPPKSKMNKLLYSVPPFQFVSVDKNYTEIFSKQSQES